MNLVETLKGQLGGPIVQQIAQYFGLDVSQIEKFLDGALPSILGGFGQLSQTADGASQLATLANSPSVPGDLEKFSQISSPGSADSMLAEGNSLVEKSFGGDSEAVAAKLGEHAGIDPAKAGGILAMLAPLVLGLLGKIIPGGFSADGLRSLLKDQLPNIANAMPRGLSIPGLGLLSGAGATAAAAAATSASSATSGATTYLKSVADSTPSPAANDSKGSNLIWALLPLFAIGAVIAYLIMNPLPKEADAASEPKALAGTPIEKPSVATEPAAAMEPSATAQGSGMTEKDLPSGEKLTFPAESIEANLIAFIEDANRPVDKTTWFTFDRLNFDTGKATIKPDSQAVLDNIAKILAAYPKVKLKIGGYTDNTGNEQSNLKLSGDRAAATREALVKLGVAEDRLDPEGYGSQHPKAPNDTEEGRAQNRRIDVRVTEK
ncbi:MAG: OmpA family protein [Armatimonadetes bacterium]|nr:OmpA family protein [Armatimonadota bacterium]